MLVQKIRIEAFFVLIISVENKTALFNELIALIKNFFKTKKICLNVFGTTFLKLKFLIFIQFKSDKEKYFNLMCDCQRQAYPWFFLIDKFFSEFESEKVLGFF